MHTICTVRTHINSDCEINQITNKITQHKFHWFASCPEHVINWLALVGADEGYKCTHLRGPRINLRQRSADVIDARKRSRSFGLASVVLDKTVK